MQSTFVVYPELDALPPACAAVFEEESDFALRAEWFRNLIDTGLAQRHVVRFGVLEAEGRPLGIVPFQEERRLGVTSLTNCYSCLYRPLVSARAPLDESAFSLGSELGRRCKRFATARFDCLPAHWPGLAPFSAGLREQGLAVREYSHFGNWYEPVRGQSWEQYVAGRPGALREVLRRRGKRATRDGIHCEIIDDPQDLKRGIAAFEAVYHRSWKPPEPFPKFNAGLMKTASRLGILRLGICWHDTRPIAAQLWIVGRGSATVMKLAHDEAERARSPGTLLTAEMIQTLMSLGVDEIDFGRGDDAYKSLWTNHRRQRVGLLVANPLYLRGMAAVARHDLGRALRRGRAN